MQTEDRLKENSTKEGYLMKKKEKRWFVLEGVSLAWNTIHFSGSSGYQRKEGTQKSGITDLRNFDISRKDALEISIIPKSGTGKKKSFVLTAATKEEAQAWVNALIRACQAWQKLETDKQMDSVCGYLTKEGHNVTSLKKRWFKLNADSSVIFYYKTEKLANGEPLGSIELKNCEVDDTKFYNFGWYIRTFDDQNKMKPIKFLLKAKTKPEKSQWLTAIAQRKGVTLNLKDKKMVNLERIMQRSNTKTGLLTTTIGSSNFQALVKQEEEKEKEKETSTTNKNEQEKESEKKEEQTEPTTEEEKKKFVDVDDKVIENENDDED